jgi:hypothetical protein
VWPAKRAALHNYKRQGRLVSEKPMVEQKITHKILGKKTMTIPREKEREREHELKRATLKAHSEIKKTQIVFIQADSSSAVF